MQISVASDNHNRVFFEKAEIAMQGAQNNVEKYKEKIAELDLSASQFFSHSDPEMVKWMAGRKLDI